MTLKFSQYAKVTLLEQADIQCVLQLMTILKFSQNIEVTPVLNDRCPVRHAAVGELKIWMFLCQHLLIFWNVIRFIVGQFHVKKHLIPSNHFYINTHTSLSFSTRHFCCRLQYSSFNSGNTDEALSLCCFYVSGKTNFSVDNLESYHRHRKHLQHIVNGLLNNNQWICSPMIIT